MFWIITGLMLAAAILFIAWPLYRIEKKLSVPSLVSVLAIAAITAGVYSQIGSPNADPEQHQGELPGVDEMVTALAARLAANPDDLAGWKMLGRSYMQLGDTAAAAEAFEKAVALESGENGQTLADLGEALLLSDGQSLTGRAGQLFENAYALAPSNPKALFYSGMAAVERGENELGASRWEALLATSPPANVADILRQRIAELRDTGPEAPLPNAAETTGAALTARVALGPSAAAAGLPDATVFVIVRDPAQPVPPIAAVRRSLRELPDDVAIADSDAMIPGRVPSGFERLEIIARVSLTGQPTAQTGDWFGSRIVETASADVIDILIDRQVP
jgi:cytochrome c-type biogenesis protein CcmH